MKCNYEETPGKSKLWNNLQSNCPVLFKSSKKDKDTKEICQLKAMWDHELDPGMEKGHWWDKIHPDKI